MQCKLAGIVFLASQVLPVSFHSLQYNEWFQFSFKAIRASITSNFTIVLPVMALMVFSSLPGFLAFRTLYFKLTLISLLYLLFPAKTILLVLVSDKVLIPTIPVHSIYLLQSVLTSSYHILTSLCCCRFSVIGCYPSANSLSEQCLFCSFLLVFLVMLIRCSAKS